MNGPLFKGFCAGAAGVLHAVAVALVFSGDPIWHAGLLAIAGKCLLLAAVDDD